LAYYVPEREQYEREVAEFCKVKDGECFIDVGAHLGIYTLRMAKQGANVHAFEPSHEIYRILQSNTKDFTNIVTYPYALSDTNSELEFYLLEDKYKIYNRFVISTGVYGYPMRRIKVPVRTLDSFGFHNVGLVKVDTEGHEVQVLRGALRTLREQKPTLILELHEPIWKQDIQIMAIIHSLKYNHIKRVWRSHHRKYFIVAHD